MSTDIRWNWKMDQFANRAGQLRLQLSDGRWTNLIFNPESNVIERDGYRVDLSDVPALDSEFAITSLTRQFVRYTDDDLGPTSASEVGAYSEPEFAFELANSPELKRARKARQMSDRAYRTTRRITKAVLIVIIVFIAVVLIKTGNDIAPIQDLIPVVDTPAPVDPAAPAQ